MLASVHSGILVGPFPWLLPTNYFEPSFSMGSLHFSVSFVRRFVHHYPSFGFDSWGWFFVHFWMYWNAVVVSFGFVMKGMSWQSWNPKLERNLRMKSQISSTVDLVGIFFYSKQYAQGCRIDYRLIDSELDGSHLFEFHKWIFFLF